MPYEIKEKKGKKFSVVNKETGKVHSKGTTEEKAKKQIKAIYANMKPEHRLRHRIGLLEGVGIKDPVHKAVVNVARRLLKQEEIHGNGYFDNMKRKKIILKKKIINGRGFWETVHKKLVETFPVLILVIGGTTPEMVEKAIEVYGPTAVEIAVPELAPFIATYQATHMHGHEADLPYYTTEEEQFAHLQNNNNNNYEDDYDEDEYEEPEEPGTMEDYSGDTIEFQNIRNESDINVEAEIEKMIDPAKPKDKLTPVERLDKLVERVLEINAPINTLDEAVRFPMIYNYDDNNKPMYLQEWLISNGVAGHNFSREEFGNTYKNQQPYAFLNFPINGGRLGKIDYSSVGYSKY
jgi:hypothetical protein